MGRWLERVFLSLFCLFRPLEALGRRLERLCMGLDALFQPLERLGESLDYRSFGEVERARAAGGGGGSWGERGGFTDGGRRGKKFLKFFRNFGVLARL